MKVKIKTKIKIPDIYRHLDKFNKQKKKYNKVQKAFKTTQMYKKIKKTKIKLVNLNKKFKIKLKKNPIRNPILLKNWMHLKKNHLKMKI